MKVEIVNTELKLDVFGFSATAFDKNYAGTAFKLMDKMWQVVKSEGLKNKGMNIWVYEPHDKVFAGVELIDAAKTNTGLEQKSISLKNYAYFKHIGPYSLIKKAGDGMRHELERLGYKTSIPYIEIYGHWTNDESKLETELLMAID